MYAGKLFQMIDAANQESIMKDLSEHHRRENARSNQPDGLGQRAAKRPDGMENSDGLIYGLFDSIFNILLDT